MRKIEICEPEPARASQKVRPRVKKLVRQLVSRQADKIAGTHDIQRLVAFSRSAYQADEVNSAGS